MLSSFQSSSHDSFVNQIGWGSLSLISLSLSLRFRGDGCSIFLGGVLVSDLGSVGNGGKRVTI